MATGYGNNLHCQFRLNCYDCNMPYHDKSSEPNTKLVCFHIACICIRLCSSLFLPRRWQSRSHASAISCFWVYTEDFVVGNETIFPGQLLPMELSSLCFILYQRGLILHSGGDENGWIARRLERLAQDLEILGSSRVMLSTRCENELLIMSTSNS